MNLQPPEKILFSIFVSISRSAPISIHIHKIEDLKPELDRVCNYLTGIQNQKGEIHIKYHKRMKLAEERLKQVETNNQAREDLYYIIRQLNQEDIRFVSFPNLMELLNIPMEKRTNIFSRDVVIPTMEKLGWVQTKLKNTRGYKPLCGWQHPTDPTFHNPNLFNPKNVEDIKVTLQQPPVQKPQETTFKCQHCNREWPLSYHVTILDVPGCMRCLTPDVYEAQFEL